MKVYYQGYKGAYSHQVGLEIAKYYNIDKDNIIGVFSFKDIFENILEKNAIGIIPIENSYAGSVYENFHNLVKYDIKIIGEFFLEISHCLVSASKDISTIKKAFSHYQALMQCENYLQKKGIEAKIYGDTAGSAKYVKKENNDKYAAISSELAGKIYGLNILEKGINDKKDNTTRFFIVVPKNLQIKEYSKDNKISIVFKTKDIPAVLYKCLGAFATNNINLAKIESIPTKENQFEYMFWLDFINPNNNKTLENTLNELKFFAKDIKILGNY